LNERLRAPTDTENHKGESINRETEVRMPFHDLEFLIEGECAIDLAHHFI
jgi:phosphatidylserine/phosphatidylglycerophosphate/cardiolipin synthase-like enzyme